MKKLLLALLTASVLVSAAVSPADAHRKRSKIKGPFGSWTWGPDIPHYHPPAPSESCLGSCGGGPNPGNNYHKPSRPRPSRSNLKYGYRIRNVDSSQWITYYIGNTKYRLAPGKSRVHRTNSRYKTIEFDRIYRSGSWERKDIRLDVDKYDLNVYYKGKYLRYSTPRD